jgi:hypothetical protein
VRYVVGFFRFWYDFIVGDAWEIAAGVVVVLAVGAFLASREALPEEQITLLVGVGIVLVFGASLAFEAWRRSRAAQGA